MTPDQIAIRHGHVRDMLHGIMMLAAELGSRDNQTADTVATVAKVTIGMLNDLDGEIELEDVA